jgi:hypothetical protein
MKNKYSIITASLALALAGTASQAHAANVIWNTVQTISADTDISTTGTYIGSIAPANGSTQTVNGVTFTNTFSGGVSYTQNGWGFGDWDFTQGQTTGLSTSYAALLDGGSPNITSLTLTGLSVGYSYEVQLWIADYRSYVTRSDGNTITSGANTSGELLFAGADGVRGSYVIGSFTADNANQAFAINDLGAGTQLNALQLRQTAIPEPSAALLGGLGMLALLRRRRA